MAVVELVSYGQTHVCPYLHAVLELMAIVLVSRWTPKFSAGMLRGQIVPTLRLFGYDV